MPALEFGRYVLVAPLAVGGMGEVHLAVDRGAPGAVAGFRRPCVIKRIKPELLARPDVAGMFAREAACAALLNHANIVTLLDHGTQDGVAFLALEYVPGINVKVLLDAHRARGMPVPWPVVVHVAHGMASALDAAHRARGPDGAPLKLIHRDVSPQNVLLGLAGEVKLTDFGMAKGALRGHYETQEQSLKGKLAYFSPEQASGEGLDQRTDLFSLGTVLNELATLQHPFGQDLEGLALLDRVKRAEMAPPQTLRADLPPLYQQVLAGCLMRDPADRFSQARDVVLLLEELAAEVRPLPSNLQLHNHLAWLEFPPPPRWDAAVTSSGTPDPPPATTRESQRPIQSAPPSTQPALQPAARITAASPRPVVPSLDIPEPDLDPTTAGHAADVVVRSSWGWVAGAGLVAAGLLAGTAAVAWMRPDPPPVPAQEVPAPEVVAPDAPPAAENPNPREKTVAPPRLKPRPVRGNEPGSANSAAAPLPTTPAGGLQPTPAPVEGTPVPSVSPAPAVSPTPVMAPTPVVLPPPTQPPAGTLVPPTTVSHAPMTLPPSPGVPPRPGVRFNAHAKVRVTLDGVPAVEALQGKLEAPGAALVRFELGGDQYVLLALKDEPGGARSAQLNSNVDGRVLWNGRPLQPGAALAIPRTGCVLTVATRQQALVVTVR